MGSDLVADIFVLPEIVPYSVLYGRLLIVGFMVIWVIGGLWYVRRSRNRRQTPLSFHAQNQEILQSLPSRKASHVVLWVMILILGMVALWSRAFEPIFDRVRVYRDHVQLSFSSGHSDVTIPLRDVGGISLSGRRSLKRSSTWIELRVRYGPTYKSVAPPNYKALPSLKSAYERLEKALLEASQQPSPNEFPPARD